MCAFWCTKNHYSRSRSARTREIQRLEQGSLFNVFLMELGPFFQPTFETDVFQASVFVLLYCILKPDNFMSFLCFLCFQSQNVSQAEIDTVCARFPSNECNMCPGYTSVFLPPSRVLERWPYWITGLIFFYLIVQFLWIELGQNKLFLYDTPNV